MLQLADLQNHGGLILGEVIAYREDFNFLNPPLSFTFEGSNIAKPVPGNPAGDPRRLLLWLLNDCRCRGITLERGTVVTSGSYTGMHFPGSAGRVRGEILGLPVLDFSLRA